MYAQVHYLVKFIGYLPSEIAKKHWDFCDKLFQHILLPRVILLGVIFIMSVVLAILDFSTSIKWWILLTVIFVTFSIAIPRKLYTWKLVLALISLPKTFCIMFLNIFKLRGANKKFIHTSHGVTDNK